MPHTTCSAPAASTVAPISPPTSAWEDEDGRPRHQVSRFQAIAPISPASTTTIAWLAARLLRSTKPPMVLATAVPPSSGPRNSKTPTTATACPGVMAREAMTVATTLAASWKPLV